MISEYFKKLCGGFQILYRLGNLKSVTSVGDERAIALLRLFIFRERNDSDAFFAEIHTVVYQLFA